MQDNQAIIKSNPTLNTSKGVGNGKKKQWTLDIDLAQKFHYSSSNPTPTFFYVTLTPKAFIAYRFSSSWK